MAVIRGYIAASLDGYVADAAGGVDWLAPYAAVDGGYRDFIDQVGTVVMGRRTHDQIPSLGLGWPYAGKRGLVVTSGPGASVQPGTRFWTAGLPALIGCLRDLDDGDAWVVGGATLLAAMIAAGALDRLELLVAPLLLGEGTRLFPPPVRGLKGMALNRVEALERGMVRLDYGLSYRPVKRSAAAQPPSSPGLSGGPKLDQPPRLGSPEQVGG
ncbi:dihydrofolate reductase [Caulobacter sp. AP07]|uniref:dihydrofolate reductase family protein n=1 Tax=Caulobacter sp. AP07 TaxID=1144304 RepID=UPI00027206C7|nr:dihydrofolate reductase family protein [Caulobacter sp. AP07]EJL33625.1 dihydrofolate reductase [Caulobacter sp. AP07]